MSWAVCVLLLDTERYGDREGGYTRVKPEAQLRRGDGTEMAILELV